MYMKPITAILFLSLAAVGSACSDSVSGKGSEADAAAPAETASAESEVQGTLNLNIGRAPEGRGGLNVSSGSIDNSGGLIVGPSSTGGNIADVEGLGVEIQDAPESVLDAPPPKDENAEDELIRIPERK